MTRSNVKSMVVFLTVTWKHGSASSLTLACSYLFKKKISSLNLMFLTLKLIFLKIRFAPLVGLMYNS